MKHFKRTILIIISLALFTGATLQASTWTRDEERFSRDELAQMLAPIALYPDSLLAQVLMASTYPLEIVEAERWLKREKGLEGDRLYSALLEKDWDTSIKSLCNFPDILFALSDKIEQTRRLGDAFLLQEEEVMDVIQELRNSAYEMGNLKSTKEQKVIVEHKIIRVEPAIARMVYVPVYDPYYVYGPWRYSGYPPYYWYYPSSRNARVTYISFGSPFSIGIGWYSWAWFDWSSCHVRITVNDARRYHRPIVYKYIDRSHWRHDPRHRRGIDYRHREIRERYENPARLVAKAPVKDGMPLKKKDASQSQSPSDRRERKDYIDNRDKRDFGMKEDKEKGPSAVTKKREEPFTIPEKKVSPGKKITVTDDKEVVTPTSRLRVDKFKKEDIKITRGEIRERVVNVIQRRTEEVQKRTTSSAGQGSRSLPVRSGISEPLRNGRIRRR